MACFNLQYGLPVFSFHIFVQSHSNVPNVLQAAANVGGGIAAHAAVQTLVAGWQALGMVERGDFVGII